MLDATDEQMPEPAIVGTHGRAWLCDVEAHLMRKCVERAADAAVAAWVVEAPWAHPVWHSYIVTLIHLRPLVPPVRTKIYLAGATHEFWVSALSPDYRRAPTVLGTEAVHRLSPLNFAAQIIAESDAAAGALIESAVTDICAGTLSPDTDFTSHWIARFGSNMMMRK